MPITTEQLERQEDKLKKRLERSFPGLLPDFSIARYTRPLRQSDPHTQYELFPRAITAALDRISDQFGQEAVALYHKIGLCRLMIDALEDPGSYQLPAAIDSLRMSWFERIVEDFSTQPDSYYDINRPLWPLRKDIGVCSTRSIPVGGAWVVESRYLPRRGLIRQASRRAVSSGRSSSRLIASRPSFTRSLPIQPVRRTAQRIRNAVLLAAGRFDRCFVVHTIERNTRNFDSAHMELAYRNIASLLANNEDVWGVYRSSWFLDPAVAEISPNMAFLSRVPVNFGAELYEGGPCSPGDIAKATLFSPERSRLFKSGRYVPKVYFYFWERQALISAFGDERPPARASDRRVFIEHSYE